jgi:seryl-tRNA synthetase
MLLVSEIIKNVDKISSLMSKRNIDVKSKLTSIIETDKLRRSTQSNLDNILSESNKLAKDIGSLFKSGEVKKATLLKEKAGNLKTESKDLSLKLSTISNELNSLLLEIPNTPNELVPSGSKEEDNLEVFTHGEIPVLHEKALSHWDLATKLDIIDFELGNKITGAGFPVYKDKGAKLQRALINYFIDKNTEAGYKEIQVPILVNEDSGMGTGNLPDKEGQMYYVTEDNLYLVPTAEVPVTNIFRNTIVKSSELPICSNQLHSMFSEEKQVVMVLTLGV